ncbi:MAG: RluA family pseudouridine synthase [Planctomycetota bacterium]
MTDEHLDIERLLSATERCEFVVEPEADGQRLDRFLAEKMHFASRRRLQDHIRRGAVALEGRPARPSRRLCAGEIVRIEYEKIGRDLNRPDDIELEVLFEDDVLLAIDKPSGLAAHPAGQEVARTVLTVACLQAGHRAYRRLPHRLDRETSGVLVLAKTPQAQRALSDAFSGDHVQKEYVAVVTGQLEAENGTIDRPLLREGYLSVCREHPDAKLARTDWSLEMRGERATRLALWPRTGRRHQLRAHLASIGHPILGDPLYGDAGSAPRLALHARRIELPHPRTGRALEIVAPVPDHPVFHLT